MSGFAEKLNIQTYVNSTGNYVRYSYGMSGFEDKFENPELRKFNWKLCALNVRNVWFCLEIEYPKFRKFSGKLCILYIQGIS